MPGGYAEFKSAPKSLITADQIGSGQIGLRHFEPGLYSEIKALGSHNHSGTKSRRIKFTDLEGAYGREGFYMYSSDGTKKYHVTIDSGTNAFVLTQV